MTMRILTGDCRDVLKTLDDESVHCCVTSPPYWGLRDYGVEGQLGLEPDFNDYIATMIQVFREVRRVLRRDGTLWLNLGDSYAGSWGNQGRKEERGTQRPINGGMLTPVHDGRYPAKQSNTGKIPEGSGLKPKDLCGIPWRLAFALQADGWWLRQDIIWSKPNPMPESVTDRCTKAHEYIFLLSKSAKYYYDAEAIKETSVGANTHGSNATPIPGRNDQAADLSRVWGGTTRNKRSVWEVSTAPFSEAHFATFPPALIEPCIKAATSEKGCCAKCGTPWVRQTDRTSAESERSARGKALTSPRNDGAAWNENNGRGFMPVESKTFGWSPSCECIDSLSPSAVPCTVLDPFGGAGTTGLVADRLQRNAILIELNPEYAAMAERRIHDDAPLFAMAAE